VLKTERMILHAMEFKHKWSIWIRRPGKEGTSGIIVKVEKEEVEEDEDNEVGEE
jgi:hypothetical protein